MVREMRVPPGAAAFANESSQLITAQWMRAAPVNSTPYSWATNMAVTASCSALPLLLSGMPSGSTRSQMSRRRPILRFASSISTGSVIAEEMVAAAMTTIGTVLRKSFPIGSLQ